MTPSRIQFASALCLIIFAGLFPIVMVGQEIDPADPFFLAAGVDRADLIVVGIFRVNWFYPWFDGWRYRGTLHVEKVLDGGSRADSRIEFQWKEVYGATCLICDQLSRIDRRRGIWMLRMKGDLWEFSGTAANPCGWELPLRVQGAVERAIREKPLKAQRP